jgi:hypothetical protein
LAPATALFELKEKPFQSPPISNLLRLLMCVCVCRRPSLWAAAPALLEGKKNLFQTITRKE